MMVSVSEHYCQREEGKSSSRVSNDSHSFKEQQVSLTQTSSIQVSSTQVSLIRKELVVLTGNHFKAVILNQLLYWTQRVKDFDLLLEEERSFHPECNVSPRHGWIYKTANELIGETMLGISHPTMRKYLRLLVDQGWIDERTHPLNKWNKTTQYRVNLRKLQEDLIAIGLSLPDIYVKSFLSSPQEEEHLSQFPKTCSSKETGDVTDSKPNPIPLQPNVKNLQSNENGNEPLLDSSCKSEEISNVRNLHSNAENFHSNVKNLHSNVRNLHSNVRNLHSYTYTENTTENKSREHTTRARETAILMVDLWRRYVNQDPITLTDERKRRLRDLFSLHFQNDLSQWEQFCERVQSSSFLMGEGSRRWRATLDWILIEANLLKVLEGNFDDPEKIEKKKENALQPQRDKERFDILASIEDQIWKDWCSQLCLRVQRNNPLSLTVLKDISRARFREFDEKLVWIDCEDQKALNCIEALCFDFLSVVQRTFPKARNIRTQVTPLPLIRQEGDQRLGENHAE